MMLIKNYFQQQMKMMNPRGKLASKKRLFYHQKFTKGIKYSQENYFLRLLKTSILSCLNENIFCVMRIPLDLKTIY